MELDKPVDELPYTLNTRVTSNVMKSEAVLKPRKGLKRKKFSSSSMPKNALVLLNEMYRGLVFQTISQEGPVHSPMFTIAVKINDRVFEGKGKSKKIAKHNAAEAALRTFGFPCTDLAIGTFKVFRSSETTDFTSDISYKEVNSFDASKIPEPYYNGDRNGLSKIRKPPGLKSYIHPGDKSPVMMLNELHPNIKYVVLSKDALTHNRYTTEVIVDDQSFLGVGPSKKLSKAAAARSALAALHNISFSTIELNGGTNGAQTFGCEIPQVFADHVSRIIMTKFRDIMENYSTYTKRKVLSGIVLSKGYDQDSCRVIAISTGTKCVNGEHLSAYGTVVNDSHAEIISRRCLMKFLYSELLKYLSGGDNIDTIFERVSEGEGLRVKQDYLFHLFINTAPCGDSRIFSPHDEQIVDKHPNRKARGQLRTKIECGEGTIPVKQNDSIQTWDGVLQGERLLTMSCSDKIAKWNVVGVQGALLSNFVEPIYLESIILGSLYHPEHLSRALFGRVEKVLQALPPPYRLNKPKMALISNKEERQLGKPPNFSVNWTYGDEYPEIVSSVTGKTEQNEVSRLAKCRMFNKFMTLAEMIPSNTIRGACGIPKTYKECKDKAVLYQIAKKQLYTAFQKASLGCWVKKPFEIDEFEWVKELPACKEIG